LAVASTHFNAMTAKIEIYTKFACPYCFRAKLLLEGKGAAYQEIDAISGSRREEMLSRSNGQSTVPQIFIDGIHVGGSDDLHALDAAGKLDPLLARAAAG
jgi:glutaredoxin 3